MPPCQLQFTVAMCVHRRKPMLSNAFGRKSVQSVPPCHNHGVPPTATFRTVSDTNSMRLLPLSPLPPTWGNGRPTYQTQTAGRCIRKQIMAHRLKCSDSRGRDQTHGWSPCRATGILFQGAARSIRDRNRLHSAYYFREGPSGCSCACLSFFFRVGGCSVSSESPTSAGLISSDGPDGLFD